MATSDWLTLRTSWSGGWDNGYVFTANNGGNSVDYSKIYDKTADYIVAKDNLTDADLLKFIAVQNKEALLDLAELRQADKDG